MYRVIKMGIASNGDAINGVYTFETYNQALKALHSTYSGYIEGCRRIVVIMIDLDSVIYGNLVWRAEGEEE